MRVGALRVTVAAPCHAMSFSLAYGCMVVVLSGEGFQVVSGGLLVRAGGCKVFKGANFACISATVVYVAPLPIR